MTIGYEYIRSEIRKKIPQKSGIRRKAPRNKESRKK
jgi:hypothetical protein